jgi:hypothetical protein
VILLFISSLHVFSSSFLHSLTSLCLCLSSSYGVAFAYVPFSYFTFSLPLTSLMNYVSLCHSSDAILLHAPSYLCYLCLTFFVPLLNLLPYPLSINPAFTSSLNLIIVLPHLAAFHFIFTTVTTSLLFLCRFTQYSICCRIHHP